ncbi:MAG: DUF2785 domain-containing protein [Acidobacteria bacterium]|nr:DUF2785 domain-containing protein [Acidobacteriota bacterium]
MRRSWLVPALVLTLVCATSASAQTRTREQWLALATGGFAVPAGETPYGLLVEMNALLPSPDPGLRDEVAYSAAAAWIVSKRLVGPDDLRRLITLWSANLDDGLGTSGDDRVLRRSFSALCLSLIAAREAATPFLAAAEVEALTARLLDYFARERDTRGFLPGRGWLHSVAHTADAFKFLARGSHWTPAQTSGLLDAMARKLDAVDSVFVWGEPERLGAALHAAVRRPDADTSAFEAWTTRWVERHTALWAGGPDIDPARFAVVENAKQTLRALVALLAMETSPTPAGEAARCAALSALARMR